MSESFKKLLYIGKVNVTDHGVQRKSVYVTIDFLAGVNSIPVGNFKSKLSICGVIQPRKNGNCHSCGQILDILKDSDWVFEKHWDRAKKQRLHSVWERWHLNNMRAGTQKQEDLLRQHKIKGDYDAKCAFLESHDMLVDDGYKYGSAWLHEEIPEEVLDFLKSLPDATKQPAWAF